MSKTPIITTLFIRGIGHQQLKAAYIKSGNQYRQRYQVNMNNGHVRTIFTTQLLKEAMPYNLLDMFYAYGEPPIEPEVLLPKEIVGTWETEGTEIPCVIKGDGDCSALDYDETGAFIQGALREYGLFNLNGIPNISYCRLDSEMLPATKSHCKDWTLVYTRITPST